MSDNSAWKMQRTGAMDGAGHPLKPGDTVTYNPDNNRFDASELMDRVGTIDDVSHEGGDDYLVTVNWGANQEVGISDEWSADLLKQTTDPRVAAQDGPSGPDVKLANGYIEKVAYGGYELIDTTDNDSHDSGSKEQMQEDADFRNADEGGTRWVVKPEGYSDKNFKEGKTADGDQLFNPDDINKSINFHGNAPYATENESGWGAHPNPKPNGAVPSISNIEVGDWIEVVNPQGQLGMPGGLKQVTEVHTSGELGCMVSVDNGTSREMLDENSLKKYKFASKTAGFGELQQGGNIGLTVVNREGQWGEIIGWDPEQSALCAIELEDGDQIWEDVADIKVAGPTASKTADWHEEQHARDHGKFAPKNGPKGDEPAGTEKPMDPDDMNPGSIGDVLPGVVDNLKNMTDDKQVHRDLDDAIIDPDAPGHSTPKDLGFGDDDDEDPDYDTRLEQIGNIDPQGDPSQFDQHDDARLKALRDECQEQYEVAMDDDDEDGMAQAMAVGKAISGELARRQESGGDDEWRNDDGQTQAEEDAAADEGLAEMGLDRHGDPLDTRTPEEMDSDDYEQDFEDQALGKTQMQYLSGEGTDAWMEDEAELNKAYDLMGEVATEDKQNMDPEKLKGLEPDQLRRIWQLTNSMYQAEEEDTELDRDSDEFMVQQGSLQDDMAAIEKILDEKMDGDMYSQGNRWNYTGGFGYDSAGLSAIPTPDNIVTPGAETDDDDDSDEDDEISQGVNHSPSGGFAAHGSSVVSSLLNSPPAADEPANLDFLQGL